MQVRGDCQDLIIGNDVTASLVDRLKGLQHTRSLVLGMGNILRGDDAAGPMVCQRVAGRLSAKIIDAGTVPENYLGPILGYAPENVLIVDAMDLGSPVGTIKVLPRIGVPALGSTTHSLSPRLLADAMAQGISGEVYFLGIQPGHVRLGDPLSPEVNRAVETVAHVLLGLFPSEGEDGSVGSTPWPGRSGAK